MIYTHPVGGMGNMFFNIAALYTLAKDNNDDLCLINIDKKIIDLVNDYRWDGSHAPIFRYFLDRFPQMNIPENYGSEHSFTYEPIHYINEKVYKGYFQSEKYFKHRKEEIINLFRPADIYLPKINKYSDLFGNISLHVRRNDYKNYSYIHTLQTKEYYEAALALFPKDLKVIVFSDEMEWCKQTFIGDRFIFMNEMDYIEIYLMTKMKYHVIANSSFSWWGAWMCNSEMVVAPKNWFGCIYNDKDIIPENWIRL